MIHHNKSKACTATTTSVSAQSALRRYLPVLFGLLVSLPWTEPRSVSLSADGENAGRTYQFLPEVTPRGLLLHVTLAFRVGANGTETLMLPTHWAGETLHAIKNLRMLSKGALLDDGPDTSTKILHAAAHHSVLIGYDLIKDWTGPLVHPLQFHPVLMPEYFEFTGSNALLRLLLPDEAPETANFDWQRLPPGWALATSFGTSISTKDRCQTYTGPWARRRSRPLHSR
jgi:hypothetical protein